MLRQLADDCYSEIRNVPIFRPLLYPPAENQANYPKQGHAGGPDEGHPAEAARESAAVLQWYPSCATLPRNTQYDHAVYARITGTSTAAPTSMNTWLDSGAAAICSVMLFGTR